MKKKFINSDKTKIQKWMNPVDWFNKNGDILILLDKQKWKIEDGYLFGPGGNIEGGNEEEKKTKGDFKINNSGLIIPQYKNTWGMQPDFEYTKFEFLTIVVFSESHYRAYYWVLFQLMKVPVPYIRVGTDYYKIIYKTNRYGVKTRELKKWKKDELKEDYGRPFIKHIPKFNDFIIEPNNIEYTPVLDEFFNMYCEFPHTPVEGEFPHIEKLLRHIFDNQYELGLRYMQLLYLYPKQILPILVLTSKDRETGKTTFLNLLNIMFADNYVQISPQDLISQFNSIYAVKNIIGIDETVVEKQSTVEKLKSIVTQKTITVNDKFISQYTVPFFGKVVIATNREKDFMRIDEEEIRFWVRKVPTIKEKITDIENKMMKEVPAFLHYLSKMTPVDFSLDRMVFTKDEIKTEFLEDVVQESRSSIYKELCIYISDLFYQNEFKEFYATATDIKHKWFHNNNQITANYIGKVIKEELKILPESVCRYLPFHPNIDPNSIEGVRISADKKVGAPFMFLRKNFIEKEIKTADVKPLFDPF